LILLGFATSCASKNIEINGVESGADADAGPKADRCVASESTAMTGKVVEEALGATAGQPIANVEIQSSPTISNVNTTDAAGTFSVEVACDARVYTITAHKLGYVDRALQATADVKKIDLAFTMVRDEQYKFVTITVLDAASSEPLEGAVVTTAAVGAEANFATNPSGTLSFPFPASTSGGVRMTVMKNGYGAVVGDYDVGAGSFQQISGKGTASATSAGLTVSLTKAD
jgi:hypothetical protein